MTLHIHIRVSLSWLIILIFLVGLKQRQRGKALRLWISNVNIKRIAIPHLNYSASRALHTQTFTYLFHINVCLYILINVNSNSFEVLRFHDSFLLFPLYNLKHKRNANMFIRFPNRSSIKQNKRYMFESLMIRQTLDILSSWFFLTRFKIHSTDIVWANNELSFSQH